MVPCKVFPVCFMASDGRCFKIHYRRSISITGVRFRYLMSLCSQAFFIVGIETQSTSSCGFGFGARRPLIPGSRVVTVACCARLLGAGPLATGHKRHVLSNCMCRLFRFLGKKIKGSIKKVPSQQLVFVKKLENTEAVSVPSATPRCARANAAAAAAARLLLRSDWSSVSQSMSYFWYLSGCACGCWMWGKAERGSGGLMRF